MADKSYTAANTSAVRVPQPPQKQLGGSTGSSLAAAAPPSLSGSATLENVVRLMEDNASAHQFDRHALELSTIVASAKSYTVQQALHFIPKIVAHICHAIRNDVVGATGASRPSDVLMTPLSQVLELCAKPFLARTLDEQRSYQSALGCTMDAVSSCLSLPQPQLRAVAAIALRNIFTFIRDQCGDDVNTKPGAHANQKRKEYWQAIRPSTILGIVAAWSAALNAAQEERQRVAILEEEAKRGFDEEDPDEGVLAPIRTTSTEAGAAEMVSLLKACVELSHYKSLCGALTDSGACLLACRTMRLCHAGDRRLTLCVELLWNLLQLHGPAAEACSNSTATQAIYDVFVFVLSMGYKLKERELRNDFVILVTLIADCDDSMPLLIPFADMMLDLSCGAERESENPHINPKFHHTTNHEELQMKTLAWKFLEKLCHKSDTYAKAIFDWGFLDILLRYINIRCEQPAVVRWSTEQLLDLQRSVLNILLLLAPLAGEYYAANGTIPTLVEYTHECPDKPLRNLAVGVLAAIARTSMRKHLADCGIIQLALELLQLPDQFDNVLRVDCLSILADVVDREPQLQHEFLQWDGIATVIPLLSFNPDYYTDLRDSIVFNALDCLWSCVSGSPDCEEAFVREDGIHHILRVLETCPSQMKRFPLTCLADLLRQPSAVVEFREWVSTLTQRSAAQVLLSLWTGTDASSNTVSVDDVDVPLDGTNESVGGDGVPIGLKSIGASTKRTNLSARPPSASRSARRSDSMCGEEQSTRRGEHQGDECQDWFGTIKRNGLIEVPEDIAQLVEENVINLKVYCCFAQVGLDDHKELSPLERSTLAAVQVFVELCKDEVWTAVADSIANDGLMPVAADQEKLRRVREVALARCQELQTTRQALSKAQEDQITAAEDIFYRTLIKKTDEKLPTGQKGSALSITEAKIRKALMLKASFKAAMAKQQSHRSGASPNTSVPPGPPTPTGGALTVNTSGSNAVERTKSISAPSVPRGGNERWGLGQRAMSDTEYALLQMLNKVRTDPKSLIPHLKQKLTYLNEEGNAFMEPGKAVENCVEGAAPYNELIEMLEASRPIVTLLDVPMGLLLAARDHVTDLGKRMEATQEGADGSTPQMRMNRYGKVGSKSTQLLSLNHQEALDIVIQLAVDDGISSRIDRKAIFDPDMRVCGVAMGKHSIHEHVAVVLMAHEYTDKPPNEQRDIFLKFNSPPARKL